MSKQNEVSLGQNVAFSKDSAGRFHFIVDPAQTGPQTKGSKKLDDKGRAKRPNEMVGSTGSYMTLPIADASGRECNVMLHLTRPMAVQSVRTARALRELAEEDGELGGPGEAQSVLTLKEKLAIRKLGLTEDEVLEAAADGGVNVASLLASLDA